MDRKMLIQKVFHLNFYLSRAADRHWHDNRGTENKMKLVVVDTAA